MNCPAIGLSGPFDLSAPHDPWLVVLLSLGVLLFGGVFFWLKQSLERKFRPYPAKQPALFFRWGERIAEALYLFSVLIGGIAALWIDAIYHGEENTSGWGIDCFESFRFTANHVLLYAWIGIGIAMLVLLISVFLLRSAIRSRHDVIM